MLKSHYCLNSDVLSIVNKFVSFAGICLTQIDTKQDPFMLATCILDDKYVVSASNDGSIKVWNIQSETCVHAFAEHKTGVHIVEALDNGRFVSADLNGCLKVWNIKSSDCFQLSTQLSTQERSISCCCAVDFQNIVIGFASPHKYELEIWNVDINKCWGVFHSHQGKITCIKMLANNRMVSASVDGTLKIWNVDNQQCLRVFENVCDNKDAVCAFGTSCILAPDDINKTLAVWDITTGQRLFDLPGHEAHARVTSSRSGACVISSSRQKSINVWNVNTREVSHVLQQPDWIWSQRIMDDGKIVVCFLSGQIQIWI